MKTRIGLRNASNGNGIMEEIDGKMIGKITRIKDIETGRRTQIGNIQ